MFNPFPTVPVTAQVGWTYNGALYCTQCEPEPYLSRTHGDLVQPVLRVDAQPGDICDNCLDYLDGEPELPYAHLAGAACQGCGREDPCGVHYADCTLLETGDEVIQRS